MARPRVHDETTGEALLDAADAVSVRAVADTTGVSMRAVYAVFGSKQALLDALAERGYRELSARVRGLRRTRDARRDLVRAGVKGFRGFALTHPDLYRLTFEQVTAERLQQQRVVEEARNS